MGKYAANHIVFVRFQNEKDLETLVARAESKVPEEVFVSVSAR